MFVEYLQYFPIKITQIREVHFVGSQTFETDAIIIASFFIHGHFPPICCINIPLKYYNNFFFALSPAAEYLQ